MVKKQILIVSVIGTLLLAGCGLKGPLYHPGEKAETTNGPASSTAISKKRNPFERTPAPQAQKNEKNGTGSTSPAAPPAPSGDGKTTSPAAAPPAVDPDRPATPAPTP